MRRLKWNLYVRFVVLLMSIFAIFVTNSINTSALSLGNSGWWIPISGTFWYNMNLNNHFNGTRANDNLYFNLTDVQLVYRNNNGFDVTQLYWEFGQTIPHNSLITFNITFTGHYHVFTYYGLPLQEMTVLSDSCLQGNGYYVNGPQTALQMTNSQYTTCQITALSPSYDITSMATVADMRILNVKYSQDWINALESGIIISGGGWHHLSNDSLSVSDKAWLEENLKGDTAEIEAQVDEISQALEDKNEQEQEDRDNIEQQSSDAQGSADDSQADAESAGTTLLAAFSAFVNALTNANPSNCNIDMDLGNLDLGVVNFCSLQPPPGFATLASIFMILFCVPLSIATARKVISLFRSFQT